jgi:hypothetical protein
MHIVWGAVIALLPLLVLGGQTASLLTPRRRPRPADTSTRHAPGYVVGIRREAPLDAVTLWTMVVAGVLLIFDVSAWAYFGLVGGGMYVYFGGRGLLNNVAVQREGVPVSDRKSQAISYLILASWAVVGLATIVAAMVAFLTT